MASGSGHRGIFAAAVPGSSGSSSWTTTFTDETTVGEVTEATDT